ncbi:MAG: hypothetical protein KBG60_06960 [Anaerolineaceae bacterium]|nr:hypothetical protein [Anaerolineaceae bacterium]
MSSEPQKFFQQLEKGLRIAFPAILACFILFNGISFVLAGQERLINIFDDDAYYYFTIARNLIQESRLTFDGTTLTNGFQPLWFGMLLPIFAVFQDPLAALRAVGILNTLLAGIAGYLGWLVLRKYSLIPFTFGMVLMQFCLVSFGITGMETGILLVLLLVCLLLIEKTRSWKLENLQQRHTAGLSACLALLLLARLDSIWFIIVFLGSLLVINGLKQLKLLAKLSAGPVLTLFIYMAANQVFFGNWMPASGSAKSLGGQFIEFNHLFLGQCFGTDAFTNGNLWQVFGISFLFAVGFVISVLFRFLQRRQPSDRVDLPDYYLPVCVSLSMILFYLYSLFGSSWVVWRWYGYLLLPMSVYVYPFAVEKIVSRFKRIASFNRILGFSGAVLALLACFPSVQTTVNWGLWAYTLPPAFRYENYQVARFLNESLPSESVVAMGDRAGSFAYFYQGRVLQLEGLVGDEALLQAIREDTLADYMTDFGVDYVLSYWEPPTSYERWTLHTPLPGFSIGPQAGIELCKDREAMRYVTAYQTLYLWDWPGCLDSQ